MAGVVRVGWADSGVLVRFCEEISACFVLAPPTSISDAACRFESIVGSLHWPLPMQVREANLPTKAVGVSPQPSSLEGGRTDDTSICALAPPRTRADKFNRICQRVKADPNMRNPFFRPKKTTAVFLVTECDECFETIPQQL